MKVNSIEYNQRCKSMIEDQSMNFYLMDILFLAKKCKDGTDIQTEQYLPLLEMMSLLTVQSQNIGVFFLRLSYWFRAIAANWNGFPCIYMEEIE